MSSLEHSAAFLCSCEVPFLFWSNWITLHALFALVVRPEEDRQTVKHINISTITRKKVASFLATHRYIVPVFRITSNAETNVRNLHVLCAPWEEVKAPGQNACTHEEHANSGQSLFNLDWLACCERWQLTASNCCVARHVFILLFVCFFGCRFSV